MTKLRNSFITGMIVVLPLILTVYVLRMIIGTANDMVIVPLIKVASTIIPIQSINQEIIILLAKILVFVLAMAGVALVGMATQVILFKQFMNFAEGLLLRVPFVNKVYLTIQQISHAFLGKKQVFQRVTLLEYPRKGIYVICFVTSKTQGEVQLKVSDPLLNVFVPTTPNPTSGVFVVVPESELIDLQMSVEDGMKLIVSGGVVSPRYVEQNPS